MLDTVQRGKICAVPVCRNIVWARGYCPAHYQKYRKYGYVPNTPVAVYAPAGSSPLCERDGCGKRRHARGLCHTHYTAELRALGKGRKSEDK